MTADVEIAMAVAHPWFRFDQSHVRQGGRGRKGP